jgi:2-oxo-hept-3-ene-1,7-dioate hydratase
MLSDAIRRQAADILMAAARERKQAVQLSKTWPDITIEDAYAISTEVANRRIAAGAKLIGHKVGLTSKAMQRSSQIDEPDYGHLLDDMMVADGARLVHENYCRPRVEIELAFVLGKALKGPGIGLPDVLRATEYVVPAIEIVDARLQDPRKIFDTVADNGAAAGIVIGGRPVKPMDVDLRWVAGIMYCNSEIEETGVAAGVLGHPALGVAWLANKLGQHGVTLEPGHLVLAGSSWPARSPGWCLPRRAIRCTRISARLAALRWSSFEIGSRQRACRAGEAASASMMPVRLASSTARMPIRKMPSNVPAPPIDATGAPSPCTLARLSRSAPISVPRLPPI